MKKDNIKNDLPSKGKIVFAWVALLILIGMTGGLVYLKNFSSSETNTNNNTEIKKDEIPSLVASALTTIAESFNKSSLVTQYKSDENLELYASVNKLDIEVTYKNDTIDEKVTYSYDTKTGLLSTTFNGGNEEIEKKILKVMILSCRARLNLTDDVNDKIDDFLNGINQSGLTMNNNTYSISLANPLKEESTITDDNNTDSSTNSADTSDLTKETITSSVNTSTVE